MNKVILNFFLFCFLFFLVSPGLTAQPTEKSLLAAWELKQKNDPKTLIFEKLAENRYRFKTKLFPFDGELKVFNIFIEEREREGDKSVHWGVIEVELVDQPEDFLKRHSFGYSKWLSNNRFFFDKETGKWVSSREYFAKVRKKYDRPPRISFRYAFSLFLYVVFFFILIIIIFSLRKIRKINEQSIQKSQAFFEETNQMLKMILEELKKK